MVKYWLVPIARGGLPGLTTQFYVEGKYENLESDGKNH